jgi:hypothetical protein
MRSRSPASFIDYQSPLPPPGSKPKPGPGPRPNPRPKPGPITTLAVGEEAGQIFTAVEADPVLGQRG